MRVVTGNCCDTEETRLPDTSQVLQRRSGCTTGTQEQLVAIKTLTVSSHRGFRATPCHDKKLPDHAGALANVLLHQLAARDPDEGAVCVVRHGPRQQSLARPWWPIQQHSLRSEPCGSQISCLEPRAAVMPGLCGLMNYRNMPRPLCSMARGGGAVTERGTVLMQPDHPLQATAYLGLRHSKAFKQLWMLDRQLNDLHSTSHSQTMDGMLCNASSNTAVCRGTSMRHVQDPACQQAHIRASKWSSPP